MSSKPLVELMVGVAALCVVISFALTLRRSSGDEDCIKGQVAELEAGVLASHFTAPTLEGLIADLEAEGAIECGEPTGNTLSCTALTLCGDDDEPGATLELHVGQTADGMWTFIP